MVQPHVLIKATDASCSFQRLAQVHVVVCKVVLLIGGRQWCLHSTIGENLDNSSRK
jgi:hypothetical protein